MSITVDSISSSGLTPKKQVSVSTSKTSAKTPVNTHVSTMTGESSAKKVTTEFSPQYTPSLQRSAYEGWDPFKQNNPYTQFNLEQTVSGISFGAKFLFDNSINLQNSKTRNTNSQFQFNLSFFESEESKLTASGYYNKQQRSMGVNFSYMFMREVETENGRELHKFEMDFNFSMTDIKEMSAEAHIEKEDIVKFVQRIVEEIFETSKNRDISIANIYLAKADIKEMMMVGSSEIGKNMLDLLAMAIAVAKLRELLNDNSDSQLVDLAPERLEELVVNLEKKQYSNTNMNVSIKDLGVVVEEEAVIGEDVLSETEEESASGKSD